MLGDGLKAQDANRSVRLRGSRGCCPVNLPDRKCTLTPRDQNATRRPCLPPTSLMTHSRKTRAAGCWKWKAEGTYKAPRSQRNAEKMGSLIVESGSKKRLLRSAIHDPQSLFIFVHFDVGCWMFIPPHSGLRQPARGGLG